MPTRCLHFFQPSVPHSPSSSQALASPISPSSPSKRRSLSDADGGLVCRYVNALDRSAFVGYKCGNIYRTGSLQHLRERGHGIRRASSAIFDSFPDEDFSWNIQGTTMKFEVSDDQDEILSEKNSPANAVGGRIVEQPRKSSRERFKGISGFGDMKFLEKLEPFKRFEPTDWPERDEINLACVERKVNSLEIPLSLRMIQRKMQWQKGVKEARESIRCSVKKAFSSMVFIIRELYSYSFQMREMLFYEDLQGILGKVQKEMHASFVWLFQQVFSHTPTLMVSVMILLANYSVYSMANSTVTVSTIPLQAYASTMEPVSMVDDQSHDKQMFNSSKIRSIPGSSLSGETTIGGSGSGGGKYRPVTSSTDGEGSFDRVSSEHPGAITPDGASSVGNPSMATEEGSVPSQVTKEGELRLWNSIVEEASKMHNFFRDEALDHEIFQKFVSPVHVNIEAAGYEDYSRTELVYQMGLAQEPNNTLLLNNYAMFLYLTIQDYARAEEYFKRAVKVEPKDAEAFDKYASFLWLVKKDVWAAEQTHLEAINVDPSNSYYAANYANFLWNTGGEDTCFPA